MTRNLLLRSRPRTAWSSWTVPAGVVLGMVIVHVGLADHVLDRIMSIRDAPLQILPVMQLGSVALLLKLLRTPHEPVQDTQHLNEGRARVMFERIRSLVAGGRIEGSTHVPSSEDGSISARIDGRPSYEITFLDVARLSIRTYLSTGDLSPARTAAKVMAESDDPATWSRTLIDLERRLPALSRAGEGRCRRRSDVVSAYVEALREHQVDGLATNGHFIPKSEFLWIKRKDRLLWYAILNAERTGAFFPEGLGIHPKPSDETWRARFAGSVPHEVSETF